MWRVLTPIIVLLFFPMVAVAEDAMTRLVRSSCVKCHSGDDPKGELSLDRLDVHYGETDRLETLIRVLSDQQMPPEKSDQPSEGLRLAAIDYLKLRLGEAREPARLKRLTRDEYTNTINDLFGTRFGLSEHLPPDPSGDLFNKCGETQRMSPYQVQSYLRAARFIADRLIPHERPRQRSWEFNIDNFRGTERGDFQTESEHVLTTHYPWRSILYFVETGQKQETIFRVPEFGRYWIQADAAAHFSDRGRDGQPFAGRSPLPDECSKGISRSFASGRIDALLGRNADRGVLHFIHVRQRSNVEPGKGPTAVQRSTGPIQ